MKYTSKDFKPGTIFLCEKNQYFSSLDHINDQEQEDEVFFILKKQNREYGEYLCYGMRVGYFIAAIEWLERTPELKKIG